MKFLMTIIALALLMLLNANDVKKQPDAGLRKMKAGAFLDGVAATERQSVKS